MRADGAGHLPHEEIDEAEEDDPEEGQDYVGHGLEPFKLESISGQVDDGSSGHRDRIRSDPCPVDMGPVRRLEVSNPDFSILSPEQGVSPADLRYRDHHIGSLRSSKKCPVVPDFETLCPVHEPRPRRERARAHFEITLELAGGYST